MLVRCGKCRRYMKLIVAKPVRLHCPSCDETLNVPQNCNIRLCKELRCPLDDYELLYCTTGTNGKVTNLSHCSRLFALIFTGFTRTLLFCPENLASPKYTVH